MPSRPSLQALQSRLMRGGELRQEAGASSQRELIAIVVDLIAVRVLNPSVVTNSSQVLGQTQCVFRVVRMYLRAAAWTFRLHNNTHRSHLTLRVVNEAISSKELSAERQSGRLANLALAAHTTPSRRYRDEPRRWAFPLWP